MTIYLTADLHGSAGEINQRLMQINNPKKEDIIIVLGDAGLEYGTCIQGSAKKAMKKFPGTWIIMRGNHDNRYWENHIKNSCVPQDGWELAAKSSWSTNLYLRQKKYPNIFYISDIGGLYTIQGYNFLFVPGGYSIDKDYRFLNNLPYEPKELLTYKEQEYLTNIIYSNKNNIDFICSHVAPYSILSDLEDLFLDYVNQDRVDNSMEKWLDLVIKEIPNFKHFFFGHYHDSRELNNKYTLIFRDIINLDKYIQKEGK